MEQKAGAQISAKAFIQSLIILLVLMLAAGILTQVVPAGKYARTIETGREIIAPSPSNPWRDLTIPSGAGSRPQSRCCGDLMVLPSSPLLSFC